MNAAAAFAVVLIALVVCAAIVVVGAVRSAFKGIPSPPPPPEKPKALPSKTVITRRGARTLFYNKTISMEELQRIYDSTPEDEEQ